MANHSTLQRIHTSFKFSHIPRTMLLRLYAHPQLQSFENNFAKQKGTVNMLEMRERMQREGCSY